MNLSFFKAWLKIIAFFAWMFFWIPLQAFTLLFFRTPQGYDIPKFWHASICKLFGVKIEIAGTPIHSQAIFMPNHLSYFDMPVMASLLKASFLARRDVTGVYALLIKLQQCPYVVRQRSKVGEALNESQNFLKRGGSLIIFPEATSTDGREVYPFKTNLFELAYTDAAKNVPIQPVTIEQLEAHGHPVRTQEDRDLYSWHIKMPDSYTVGHHLFNLARTSGAKLRVTFHPPIYASAYADRKALAKACQIIVSNGLQNKETETAKEWDHERAETAGNHQAASLFAEKI